MERFLIRIPLQNFIVIISGLLFLLVGACGGAGGGGQESNQLDGGGSPILANPGNNLGPSTSGEDIFDLPNTMPNSFLLAACPTSDTAHFDLVMRILSDDPYGHEERIAPLHDFDGDGDFDSILLVKDDPLPKNVILRAWGINASIRIPSDTVDFASQFSKLVGGWEYDENLNCKANQDGDIPLSFGFNLVEGAWRSSLFNPLIFQQGYIPGNNPADPNLPWAPAFSCQGFEGPAFLCGFPLPGVLRDRPGVHVVATRIQEVAPDFTRHCSQEVVRILICPVACHCDEDGNSLSFDPNCHPQPPDSTCRL